MKPAPIKVRRRPRHTAGRLTRISAMVTTEAIRESLQMALDASYDVMEYTR